MKRERLGVTDWEGMASKQGVTQNYVTCTTFFLFFFLSVGTKAYRAAAPFSLKHCVKGKRTFRKLERRWIRTNRGMLVSPDGRYRRQFTGLLRRTFQYTSQRT